MPSAQQGEAASRGCSAAVGGRARGYCPSASAPESLLWLCQKKRANHNKPAKQVLTEKVLGWGPRLCRRGSPARKPCFVSQTLAGQALAPSGRAAARRLTARQDGPGPSCVGQTHCLPGLPGDQNQVWGQAGVPCSLGTPRRLGLHGIAQETPLRELSEPQCDSISPGPLGHAPHLADPMGVPTF